MSASHQHSRGAHTDEDVLLNQAPHEFVVPTTLVQAAITLPQNVLIAFIKIYRAIVSPLYGNVCRYYPSCSAYGLEALTTHGATRGLSLTVRRLLRCHPWATGGLDPVPPGRRTFAPGSEPKIILLNHPHQHLNH
ncbi:MAG: membrane protein insertion efficiency factor YidD [Rothia sp. (in: high G+C Gram-positive bacteria)]|uniref:membrane protein insertion efficiency factor YidD n=1 Tax=Rothia sp. (in: high G+C Gram-positive bacteria) TaxID=1885016 RepID=UPI0026FA6824|nr:membrane protein insertion efficiency factor YidD [Rothia sp. (in: high G+C Gram-positive bacteria)]